MGLWYSAWLRIAEILIMQARYIVNNDLIEIEKDIKLKRLYDLLI